MPPWWHSIRDVSPLDTFVVCYLVYISYLVNTEELSSRAPFYKQAKFTRQFV